jgi:hypothetical protein
VRRTVLTVLALLGLAALGLALAVPGPAARADSTNDVGLRGFADLVVDQAHGHVFISQGSATVVVTDLAGRPVGTLTGLRGANGMALNDDGSELYVALTGADAIAQVDTTDPFAAGAVTKFPTGTDTCPLDVAYTAGLVWYEATCDSQWANLHPLDPATGTIYDTGYHPAYNSRLAASPVLPDTLFASDIGSSPSSLYEYTVTGGPTPTVSAQTHWDVNESHAFAVTSDATQVVTGGHQAFSTTDLSHVRSYGVPHSTSAVAMRTSDDLLAFGSTDGVVFYPLGATKAMGTYKFDDPDAAVVDGGLAFGSSKLYAVTFDSQSAPHYELHVITPRNRPRADVTVSVAGKPFRYGKKATVTVTLHGHRTRARLELYAVTPDGKLYFLERGHPDRHHQLSLRLAMSVNATFIGVFDGDKTVAANAAGRRATVRALVIGKMFREKGHDGRYALYRPSQKAVFGAAVGPNKKGECLYFRAQFHVHGHWGHDSTTSCATLNKRSGAGAFIQGSRQLAGIPIRIRAEWYGDTFNKRAKSSWSYARFTGSARTPTSKLGPGYGALRDLSSGPAPMGPNIRSPFSQQTDRSQSSPSSSLLNPMTWASYG